MVIERLPTRTFGPCAHIRTPRLHHACGRLRQNLQGFTDLRNPVLETKEHLMADVIFVGITIAFFALLALIIKGVERLER